MQSTLCCPIPGPPTETVCVCVCVLEIGWDSLELREKEEIAWARDQRGGSVA